MKKYTIELSDELSVIYEDIAEMNEKSVEESLSIILELVALFRLVHVPHYSQLQLY